jgi:hypothetical protein
MVENVEAVRMKDQHRRFTHLELSADGKAHVAFGLGQRITLLPRYRYRSNVAAKPIESWTLGIG